MRQFGDMRQVVVALTNLGIIPKIAGNYESAREYWLEALPLARKINHTVAESVILTNIGAMNIEQGNMRQAEQFTQEALQIALATQRKRGICKLYDNLADIAINRKAYIQARQYSQNALRVAREIDEPILLAWILANRGRTDAYLGDYEESEVYLQVSLTLAQKKRCQKGECMVLCYTGILENLRSNYSEADRAWQKSLNLARQTNNFFMINKNLYELGDLCLRQDELNTAVFFFQESLTTAQTYQFHLFEGQALFALAQIAWQQMDFVQAETHGEAALTVFNKIEYAAGHDVQQWLNKRIPV